jgi:TonB family protein
MLAYYHSPVLPWSMSEEDEERFRRILKRCFIIFLLFALALPWLPVPQIERAKIEEMPPRLAKLLLERQPPPPPVKAPEPEAPKAEAPKKAEPKPAKKAETPKPQKSVEAARAKAERSGLLAFKDDLADLRSHSAANSAQKQALVKGAGAAPGKPSERSLVTSSAAGGSGGINTASLSRDTGGGGLGGAAGTTRVGSPVGDGDGGAGGSLKRGGGGKASRSIEEIKLVFDRNKGSIYTIYNRALRENPALQGKVVLKLTIAPSGQVTECQIVSSELRAPELEKKLLARIKQFNFGAKQVEIMVVTYPIDFLPS